MAMERGRARGGGLVGRVCLVVAVGVEVERDGVELDSERL